MRLHRFYISEKIGDKTELTIDSPELINQIRRVFRLKTSDSVVLFDGTGFDYECKIDSASDRNIIVHVLATAKKRSRFQPGREVVLCAAVVKKDTFEWITEKATELGVTKIVPILAERSEKKALNMERLKKIAIEASEQSGRGDVPVIGEIRTLEEALKEYGGRNCVALHTDGMERSDLSRFNLYFIGPEGGWSPAELELFHARKVPVCSLGKQILRAETAVIAALAQVMF